MTKDLKNKLTTFLILLFACVLLLSVSLFSDYETAPSTKMDDNATKSVEMEAVKYKQASILSQMDTIESKIRIYDTNSDKDGLSSSEINKEIKELTDFLVKNGLGKNAFKGIAENYKMLLEDKKNIQNNDETNKTLQLKLADCKEELKENNRKLDTKNMIKGLSNQSTGTTK